MPGQTAELDVEPIMRLLQAIERAPFITRPLQQAVGMSAFKGERQTKEALLRMVYQGPEGAYKRTGTLRRSVTAASPEYNHDGDEAQAARSEVSRGGSGGAYLEVTRLIPNQSIEADVGSWISYAEKVHYGTTYMQARPFLDEGLASSQNDLEHYVLLVLDDLLKQVLGPQ